ncbi:MAG: hypothetical protein R6V19_12845 [Armatimonadota bacterium]
MTLTQAPQPVLYRRIEVPEEFLANDNGRPFAGDIRIGDLTGDGKVDFVVYRCADSGMKPCFLGAFDIDGNPLWRAGEEGTYPERPMSVAVHDIDGDGSTEVVCFWHVEGMEADETSLADVVVQVRDGATGEVKLEAAPDAVTSRGGEGPNWVHQRLLMADFRGNGSPQDMVVKLGDTVVALSGGLETLWTYRIAWNEYGHCAAYIPSVGDINGDGRDEVNGGYFLLSADGKPMWEGDIADHMDSVAITEWDDGNVRAICSGFGQVLDEVGNRILYLGEDVAPHGQEARVADFLSDIPGPEMVLRYNAHEPEVYVISSDTGEIVQEFSLNHTPNDTGMEPVYWNGPGERALLCNGAWLWDLQAGEHAELPDLPPPAGFEVHRMGWYHCIAADVCGDSREELVIWDPCATAVYVYSPEPLDEAAYGGYWPGPRQYNARLMD